MFLSFSVLPGSESSVHILVENNPLQKSLVTLDNCKAVGALAHCKALNLRQPSVCLPREKPDGKFANMAAIEHTRLLSSFKASTVWSCSTAKIEDGKDGEGSSQP